LQSKPPKAKAAVCVPADPNKLSLPYLNQSWISYAQVEPSYSSVVVAKPVTVVHHQKLKLAV
jgi:hypothetical protein